MKLLFVAPYVPSLIRVRSYQFVRQLAREHEVTVLAAATPAEQDAVAALRTICQRVEAVPLSVPASLRSCALGLARRQPLQARVCFLPALQRRLASLLAEQPFDCAQVEHLRAGLLGSSLVQRLPTIYDAVDCISLLLERTRQGSHSRRQRLLAALELGPTRAFEAGLLRRFERALATSAEDAAALQALAPERPPPLVLPNGVDLDYFQPFDGPPEPATVVLSGKMSYHANATAALHFVHQIWPLVRARRPDARLRIAGSGPPAALTALAHDPSIEVTGYLPDLRPALRRATLAVCPVTVKVGLQNKILEAMALGLPVVSSGAGLRGLLAEPDRDLLVADAPAAFAAAVCRLLDEPELRARLGQAGRRYVERQHRWPAIVARLSALQAEAIAAGRRPGPPERRQAAASVRDGRD
jgi:glycosyltransferase involved in cell wall biosynthesis